MSEADKLFEELGYRKKPLREKDRVELDESYVAVLNEDIMQIRFWYDKTVSKCNGNFEEEYITMQELKAINMKCKELGWSDE